eukprot:3220146-Rhodomonas_salina.1
MRCAATRWGGKLGVLVQSHARVLQLCYTVSGTDWDCACWAIKAGTAEGEEGLARITDVDMNQVCAVRAALVPP